MDKVASADGTTIAYEAWGTGPPVVIVGGAFNDRQAWAELARALAGDFTAVTYDRRGRGDSGDSRPFAVQPEIDDLAAVIEAVGNGQPVFAHGVSSGGALLVHALAAGVPVARASVLEVPYRIEGAPPPPPEYIATLTRFAESCDRAGAVEYFHTRAVGLPIEMLDPVRGTPMWDGLLAMAPTLVYDGLALGGDDQSLPVEVLAGLETPVLSISSTGTAMPWLPEAAAQLAAALPHGRHVALEGGFHEVPVNVLAPALTGFYLEKQ